MTVRRIARGTGLILGRSFFPLIALTVILGTTLWGPWVSLLLVFVLWRVVGRVA